MSNVSSVTIQYTHDAGVNKAVKNTANSLRIYDQFHIPMAGDPVGPRAIRSKVKVRNIAGILQAQPTKNFSISFGR